MGRILYIPGATKEYTEEGIMMLDTQGEIRFYFPDTNTWLYFANTGKWLADIANTETKLWGSDGNTIYEYDISLVPPFGPNYYISPVRSYSVTTGSGLAIISMDETSYTLVGSYANTIRKLVLSNGVCTAQNLFSLPVGHNVTGDILYKPISQTFIIAHNVFASFYVSEYALNGTLIYSYVVPRDMWALYEYKGLNYGVRATAELYELSNSGYTYIKTLAVGANGASQYGHYFKL